MAHKKTPSETKVESIRHKDKRTNIPTDTFSASAISSTRRHEPKPVRTLMHSCYDFEHIELFAVGRRYTLRFYPLNFYATCGEVVHHRIHYLFGCGYAALGSGVK